MEVKEKERGSFPKETSLVGDGKEGEKNGY